MIAVWDACFRIRYITFKTYKALRLRGIKPKVLDIYGQSKDRPIKEDS